MSVGTQLHNALLDLRAMKARMEACEVPTEVEYWRLRSAVITRAGMCARAGLRETAIAARNEVDAMPPLPSRPNPHANPHTCGASNCILRPQGEPRPMGVANCRCLDAQLPDDDRVRVRDGIRWLANWAGKAIAAAKEGAA